MIWRVVTHEATSGQSYVEINERWTLDDLLDANEILDAIDGARARQRKVAERP